MAVIVQQDATI